MKLLKQVLLLSCLALAVGGFSYSNGSTGNGSLALKGDSTDTGGWRISGIASNGTEGGGILAKAKSTDTGGWRTMTTSGRVGQGGGMRSAQSKERNG
ncbi:MAG: hypothetical protein HRU41_21345 [Saprospiraceae bacterium]|nr:hypothetical protein [Saprospiraceae bacterium]